MKKFNAVIITLALLLCSAVSCSKDEKATKSFSAAESSEVKETETTTAEETEKTTAAETTEEKTTEAKRQLTQRKRQRRERITAALLLSRLPSLKLRRRL